MPAIATARAATETMVGMGEASAVHAPDRLWSILGSCVAVVIYDPHQRIGAMGHIVLPSAAGRQGNPAKFADTAVPHLLHLLKQKGASGEGLVAKLAGGARMFGKSALMEVGEGNVQAILHALQAARIRVAGKDVGGSRGRRVTLDCSQGSLLVQVLGNPPLTL